MTVTWKIERIETVDGDPHTLVYWRATGEHGSTSYGVATLKNLVITADTTEAAIIATVKEKLNEFEPRKDEHGNDIPPHPGDETANTDAIDASIIARDAEIAHPKTKSIDLPWKK